MPGVLIRETEREGNVKKQAEIQVMLLSISQETSGIASTPPEARRAARTI